MGETGVLSVVDVKLGKTVLMGDTTWCRGKVIEKQQVDGENKINIDISAVNQRDEIVAQGEAIVHLQG
jgi:hypothetical protein